MDHLHRHTILNYLAGELAEVETERFEAHLEVCDLCHEQFLQLIEAGDPAEEVPPMLEAPSAGFADRVMEAVLREEAQNGAEHAAGIDETDSLAVQTPDGELGQVVPLRPRRKRPRLEAFTRFVTAAVVTGFMVLGSQQVQVLPTFGVLQTVERTGDVVTDGTYYVYSEINGLMDRVNAEFFK